MRVLVRACAAMIAASCLTAQAYASPTEAAHSLKVIVVRRGWHIDVGFAAADLEPSLRSIAADLPMARFIFFGFGDMHYLMSRNHGSSTLAAALWPGRGILLVTGLDGTPLEGFGADQVIALDLNADDAGALQAWIWSSFLADASGASVYRPGPYAESLYFLAVPRYSALHTCNTWAAEALKAGRLPVHSRGVVFAGELWSQVRRLNKTQHPAPSLAPVSR